MSNESEDKCLYISSRGILKSCDVYADNIISSRYSNIDLNKIHHNSVICITPETLTYFYLAILPNITSRFILVTCDSDNIIPYDMDSSTFNGILNNTYLTHWFATNCFIKHPKITPIPYGLDYHTQVNRPYFSSIICSPVQQEKLLLDIISKSKPFWERIPKIFIDNMTMRCNERTIAYNTVSDNICYKEPHKISRELLWDKQSCYAFVLSPPATDIDIKTITHTNVVRGGGFDCIRTWEALILGCIPVVKSSPMDYLYDDLPVWIIDDWSEVNKENACINKINEFKNKTFNYDKLRLKYWVDLFNSKK